MKPKPGITNADYKVTGGKLLRVRLQADDGIIQSIRITGDFFLFRPQAALDFIFFFVFLRDTICQFLVFLARKF